MISDREKVNVLADVVPDVGVLVPDLLVKPGGNFLDPVLTFIHGGLNLLSPFAMEKFSAQPKTPGKSRKSAKSEPVAEPLNENVPRGFCCD